MINCELYSHVYFAIHHQYTAVTHLIWVTR